MFALRHDFRNYLELSIGCHAGARTRHQATNEMADFGPCASVWGLFRRIAGHWPYQSNGSGLRLTTTFFDLQVEVEAVAAKLPADPALLEAAKRSFRRVDRRVVDTHVAGLQAAGQWCGRA